MGEIQRPGALYQQVAAEIRNAIANGEFPPGAPLPSEAQLIERYKVSRPTIRNAVAALRAEGLIEVIHGKGSFVRALPTPAVTISRAVYTNGRKFTTRDDVVWHALEQPTVYRTTTTATTGPKLALAEGEALFGCDWLLADPESGTRLMHRVLIPFATAEGTSLADEPDRQPVDIYATLTHAGHQLHWTETVTARMPQPDERTALQIPEATPVLQATRITHGNDDAPLILEELHTSASQVQLAYRISTNALGLQ
ncbi:MULTISPECIES: GntR family transcriptional regulator [Streptomyces]|uniref:GntR family transcriptional regulator n=1 Tax=Streptomyces griseocarneus TaxID=51201 RepID=A0ABX7RML0_9ACTN|nr:MULTISPECIES: GntR family transcriptional regulator [Streptomyces]QSY48116.1 GntR family transcriptional regulator [Streptomyces griseocarneus]